MKEVEIVDGSRRIPVFGMGPMLLGHTKELSESELEDLRSRGVIPIWVDEGQLRLSWWQRMLGILSRFLGH